MAWINTSILLYQPLTQGLQFAVWLVISSLAILKTFPGSSLCQRSYSRPSLIQDQDIQNLPAATGYLDTLLFGSLLFYCVQAYVFSYFHYNSCCLQDGFYVHICFFSFFVPLPFFQLTFKFPFVLLLFFSLCYFVLGKDFKISFRVFIWNILKFSY